MYRVLKFLTQEAAAVYSHDAWAKVLGREPRPDEGTQFLYPVVGYEDGSWACHVQPDVEKHLDADHEKLLAAATVDKETGFPALKRSDARDVQDRPKPKVEPIGSTKVAEAAIKR